MPLYKQPSAPIASRISDLLSRMTLEEKVSQLSPGDIAFWMNTTTNAFNPTGLKLLELHSGQIYVGRVMPSDWLASNVKIAQDYLVHNTSLGIPALIQSEGIHGLRIGNATIFNSPIGQACSWNVDLIGKMAGVIAKESRALGVNQIFAPLGDLARELRFGRVEETFGEDGYLAAEMGYAYVKGLQNGNVSATVKHFAAFASPEQGLNLGPVHGGERELRTTYLPPYKRQIIDAGAYSVMSSYNSYDGVPMIANHHVLTEILREEWGYKYWVISDSGGTDRICDVFKMCKVLDKNATATYALEAGNDVELGTRNFHWGAIPGLIHSGNMLPSVLDTAVSRVLRAKFAMGLFENPYLGLPSNEQVSAMHTTNHIELARQLDAESIVLLENHNSILPLSKNANIAVIGPMADFMNYGDYVINGSQYHGITPYKGFKRASKGVVTYSKGCERWSNDQSGFPEAVASALAADVAIVVVGTWSRDSTELWQNLNATTGEHVDVSSLKLVGAMPHLVSAIVATGKPTIVVFSSGKPITEPWISTKASALIQQFYPSEEGGNALADVIFGDVNPSGKLSVGFPYDVGTTPVYYDYLNSGREIIDVGKEEENGTLKFGHSYVLASSEPLYEFGYGKSYSTFTYSEVSLSKTTVAVTETIIATVKITNNSTRDGTEVVQLYIKDVISSVEVPNMQLKGFEKIMVKAGEAKQVRIAIKVEDLGLWNIRMKYVVEPGEFLVLIGSSSKDLRGNATFTVV
ncbi:glycoside hydrolase superfamily [Tricladium varicosporioides]|nr:glycoside hydrolase superfamily [Hymenoscyphus varicosporioides]